MNPTLKRMMVALLGLCSLSVGQMALADECDILHTLQNQEGAISLEGYGFGASVGTTRALRALTLPTGFCNSQILITTTDPALTTAVGDGVVSRKISTPSFQTRFQVDPPMLNLPLTTARSLLFRRMEFTPLYNDPQGTPGALDFHMTTQDGQRWTLSAMIYDGVNEPWLMESATPNLNVAQRFEALVELWHEFLPSLQQQRQKIRVTLYLADGTTRISNYTLPLGMRAITMRQGLLGQNNLPLNKTFAVSNCIPTMCANPVPPSAR